MGRDHLRFAGGDPGAFPLPGGAHGTKARHNYRQNAGGAGGGHHLPGGRRVPGPPEAGVRHIHPLGGRGFEPEGLHRQRHGPESPGGAPGSLRGTGGLGAKDSSLRGGPGPAVSGGRVADSPGNALCGGAEPGGGRGHRRRHGPKPGVFAGHCPGARLDRAGQAACRRQRRRGAGKSPGGCGGFLARGVAYGGV